MKKRFNIFDPSKCRNCWVCYLDLLGFKQLVRAEVMNAVHRYYQSRETVEYWCQRMQRLRLVCWSDSFVIYSDDDSAAAFWQMEQAVRWIINEHLGWHIPIRGALSCGEVYADEEDDIHIGTALIEAYEHAENQNWVGFLLCRSATQRLVKLKPAPSGRLNYRRWKIPWSRKRPELKPLYVYLIGASCAARGRNAHLEILRQMMSSAQSRRDRNKYREVIRFLEHYGVMRAVRRSEK